MFLKIILVVFTFFLMKDEYWVTVSKGAALHLNPFNNKWEPISNKEKIRKHTFVITKDHSEIIVYDEDETIAVGSNMYVYLNDLFVKDNSDLLSKLTKIQMDQLPLSKNDKNTKRTVGLTFGKLKAPKNMPEVPYLKERVNAINYYDKVKNKRTSLLILKRLMTKYPDLYFDYEYTKKLFAYYEEFKLKGMLYDESLALKRLTLEGELKHFIIKSHDKIQNELKQKSAENN